MSRHRWIAIVSATLLGLFLADTAHAMYHPRLARFVNRDPHGMQAGPGVSHDRPFAGSIPHMNGEFIGRDPIDASLQYADGMNLYQYVRSRPTALRDPTGLAAEIDVAEVRYAQVRGRSARTIPLEARFDVSIQQCPDDESKVRFDFERIEMRLRIEYEVGPKKYNYSGNDLTHETVHAAIWHLTWYQQNRAFGNMLEGLGCMCWPRALCYQDAFDTQRRYVQALNMARNYLWECADYGGQHELRQGACENAAIQFSAAARHRQKLEAQLIECRAKD